jgi:hypothetical protein
MRELLHDGTERIAFVLIDGRGVPMGTTWAERGWDALALALTLYGPGAACYLADDAPTEWLTAFDREARATHAENVRLEAERQLRARVARITEKMHKLFPWLHP